ncbi:class I SAM-dependent methyltransferase [Nocardia cyriacigeorgica]|uniref:class I SAM-dependent methyltransferase n=1 Tax=Nocardia cyriacigeorgica TaxID=135487 RepID=UPI00189408B8|nr:class I SAM-dependent methyltransferase [Nocardia cyriacigeorgica]MBF6094972.1 class I SAM-dependent methyltransferase [Nocardia cyriacigeorgica]MBF6163109.1 class I SAM-dependent methyltransferase [Nocardia cyriacigeorgica]MBF6202077.1 class I SAM-dependent methyltransferase [Nocardia cyriacigeorgica]MBF6518604.1 class I SAM-dependent methyltransferase [Nocardia cyriacigeorgica]
MSVPSLASEYTSLDPLQVRIDTHRRYSEVHDDVNGAVVETFRLTGSEYLIDVGCGTAEFLRHLVDRGHYGRLTGVDTSQAAVDAASRIKGVGAIRGAAERMPISDGACDVITSRHVLYHLEEPLRALREFHRVVRPDGIVCVVVNHARTCDNTHRLVADVAARYGLTSPGGMLNETVNSDTVPDMMSGVFGNVAVRRFDNALMIPDVAAAVRFAESLFAFCGVGQDSPHKAAVRADVETELQRWFATHQGRSWRDPKGYTVITSVRR